LLPNAIIPISFPQRLEYQFAMHTLKLAASINRQPLNSATIHGYHTATDFFKHQLLHE
jgi:hypothetical protein